MSHVDQKSLGYIVIFEEGFSLHEDDAKEVRIEWPAIGKIVAFKEDLLTFDLVCLEFHLVAGDKIVELNEDTKGFWELVEKLKAVFPDSDQAWESKVLKPAYSRNPFTIYEKQRQMPRQSFDCAQD